MILKILKKPTRVLTREEVLTLDQIKELYHSKLKNEILNKHKDVFVLQCLTGMRYGELKLINKRVINSKNNIVLKEEKKSSKQTREIPLSNIALDILEKYEYQLPLVSNQKQNESIKKIINAVGFNYDVEYTRTKGVEQERFVKKFSDRITTHTARRSFIAIMRNKGIADKTIMSISGHTDIKTFNMYHQVDDVARNNAVNSVFGSL